MKALLKNWLLPINCNSFLNKNKMGFLLILFFLLFKYSNSQIANYVNNGSFEVPKYFNAQKAKYWEATDTTKYVGVMYSAIIPPYLVPTSGPTYQWPRTGNAWFASTLLFKPNTPQTARGYPRNTLKGTLQAGKTYCVKFYSNITNNSTYGVDGLGAYFGDNTTDTIHYCMTPITYLTPQIQNPVNNILSDTLNWTLITGTFVANGTEKYMMLGNFKSDAATNSVMINSTTTVIASEVIYDDVSVIDIDLPAFAGPDVWGIPLNSVYLGRPQDVGIDEACMWYHLPNTTTAIDTAAGINVTVATTTQTYMVKQDICGNVKYDTVIVYASATGINEQETILDNVNLFPNPASDELNIALSVQTNIDFNRIFIYNSIGQLIREEEITFKNNKAFINTANLQSGVYYLNMKGINKRFVIAK
ncbi:MAG: T9SS type A sorting domain-containing protein [Bacteroidota bacterium]|nr:T9SS type A sorting domain-containing protein [Bacteroidota bacterium]